MVEILAFKYFFLPLNLKTEHQISHMVSITLAQMFQVSSAAVFVI
jgi:hypothetical protein